MPFFSENDSRHKQSLCKTWWSIHVIQHDKNENSLIIYSPSCYFKPLWLSFLCRIVVRIRWLRLCLDLCGILWSQKSQNDLKQKSKNTWQIILLNTENMLSLETDLTFNKIACRLSCQLYESTIENFCKKKRNDAYSPWNVFLH